MSRRIRLGVEPDRDWRSLSTVFCGGRRILDMGLGFSIHLLTFVSPVEIEAVVDPLAVSRDRHAAVLCDW